MRLALAAIGILFMSAVAFSATIYVPDNYPTIQDAISASTNGDTIIVRPGTYLENIDFLGRAITLKSEQGTAVTVIDGNRSGPAVVFQSGEGPGSILEDFSITNGSGSTVGGFALGGAILCGPTPSSPTIRGNLICGNDCFLGAGIGLYISSSPVISGNIIRANTGSIGTGIYCYETTALITGNVIEGNSATTYGGGIYCRDRANPMICENLISGNRSDVSGGGIYSHGATLKVANNTFHGNSSYHGGAIYASNGDGIIANNTITGNSADRRGEGGGIYCGSSTIIVRNVISGNWATQGNGGGIYCHYYDPIILNNTITDNTADYGGGIDNDDSSPTITNNTISMNRAYAYGGGLHGNSDARPVVTNTILWDNIAPAGSEIWGGGPAVTYCDVKGGWSGAGNINAIPLFADSANGDFHLTWNSPCLNAGANTAVTSFRDVEGDPRISNVTVDMGADEFYPHLYWLGDVAPGAYVSIRVVGYPGAWVWFARGTGVLDPPLPTQYGDMYLQQPFVNNWILGSVPADGVLRLPSMVPPNWVTGEQYPYQAMVGPAAPFPAMLTNHVVATVK